MEICALSIQNKDWTYRCQEYVCSVSSLLRRCGISSASKYREEIEISTII